MQLYGFDTALEQKTGSCLVGVDEAGRGPLAGPVMAAAVRLDLSRPIEGINDSKKLTPKKRDTLYELITSCAPAWSVAFATPEEIDRYNILQASLLAMRRALEGLRCAWTLALIDGNRAVPGIPPDRQKTVVAGDAQSASIAAASIIAKVTRDRQMVAYHASWPAYEFHIHKGYPTALHRERLLQHGLCPIHRRSFCEHILAQTSLPLGTVS
jgi:ribonuclease HII